MLSHSLEARRLLLVQCALTAGLAVIVAVFVGGAQATAAAFGGAIALGNAWLMSRTVARATEAARRQPGSETLVLGLGAVQRFALVAAAFALGIGALALPPVMVIVGFAVVHGAFFLSRAIVAWPTPGESRDS